jgi:hypothetical protein
MNSVENILRENIDRPDALFVFPTDIAASRWADRLLRLRGGGTIPMGKFIAWDTFKRDSVRAKVQNKKSIPAVMRKMFVTVLIGENAGLCGQGEQPVFSSLIRPEWARQADSFAGWITEILPQLGSWFNRATGLSACAIGDAVVSAIGDAASAAVGVIGSDFSGDARDLFTLMFRYAVFLEKHGLFEPAWETPPFDDTGKECFIFFPESLSDFDDYRELLEASGKVKTVRAFSPRTDSPRADSPLAEQRPSEVFFYTNSRSEITEAALYVLSLHNNHNIPWDSVSVSIPDEYGPYLFREFNNRNIPFVKQIGKPLASYPAGQFFTALANCVSDDFSFTSLTALLLNRHLPWKDGPVIQDLIQFGIKNNCISSWTENENGNNEEKINIWEDSFAHPVDSFNPQIRYFYEDLRRKAAAICHADSFANIRKHYFVFRERFFDMENCLEETDLILSRCISELMYMVEIEKSYPDVRVGDPYAFFAGYLDEPNYLARQSASGVAILPYRTAAPAPFDCHIILGASQDNLSQVFSPLQFLPKSKREKLGMTDNDASFAFINLHLFNSRLPAAFFCSEQTFSGYAIPHNALSAALKPERRYGDTAEHGAKFFRDLYRVEGDFFSSLHFPSGEKIIPAVSELHRNQKNGFKKWQTRRKHPTSGVLAGGYPLSEFVGRRFCKNENFKGKYSVSPTSLALYYKCPLKWFFERVLELENVETETELMSYNTTGLVYHAVLNLFLEELLETGEPIAMPLISGDDGIPNLPENYRTLLAEKTEAVFECFPRLPKSERPAMSMLTARLLRAEKKLFYSVLENFLAVFISYFAGYAVIASEKYYSLEKNIYYLNGIVDCILEDVREDSPDKNSALIADFKTKTIPKLQDCTTGGEGLADFQLPAYLRLAEDSLGKNVHTALFLSVIETKPTVLFGSIQNTANGNSIPKKADDRIIRGNASFTDIMNEFDRKTELFAKKISEGSFSFYPSDSEHCLECGYNKVCRTLYHICRGKNDGT